MGMLQGELRHHCSAPGMAQQVNRAQLQRIKQPEGFNSKATERHLISR